MHVVMHGTYHRGQIAAEVRAAGGAPEYTDFIHAVRAAAVGSRTRFTEISSQAKRVNLL
jgi:DinB family